MILSILEHANDAWIFFCRLACHGFVDGAYAAASDVGAMAVTIAFAAYVAGWVSVAGHWRRVSASRCSAQPCCP
jgi:hypothetical protein